MLHHFGHDARAHGLVWFHHGQARLSDGEPELPEDVANSAWTAVQETGVRQCDEPAVDGRRLRDAAILEQLEHTLLLASNNVAGDAHCPIAAHRPDVEVVVVVAAPDFEVRRGLHDRRGVGQVAARLFVADDVRHLGAAQDRFDRHVHDRAPGDVVDDHRQAGALGDRPHVTVDAFLRRLQVVGRGRENGVNAGLLGEARQCHRVTRVVRPRASNDGRGIPNFLLDPFPQPDQFVFIQQRRFPSCARQHQAVVSRADEMGGEPPGVRDINLAVLGVGGDHGRQKASELLGHRKAPKRG